VPEIACEGVPPAKLREHIGIRDTGPLIIMAAMRPPVQTGQDHRRGGAYGGVL
jgi:hypothetical protein